MLLKVENVGTIIVAESLLFGVAQRNLIGMYNGVFLRERVIYYIKLRISPKIFLFDLPFTSLLRGGSSKKRIASNYLAERTQSL